jgi:deoxyadenosine/deoxycytidine kinase
MNCSFIIVSIEGNIGSGKSTLLANLRTYYENNSDVIFLKEPVDEWEKIKDENGTTILEKFYGDQDKYSFPFQMMAYVSRLKVLRDALKGIDRTQNRRIVIITERSLYTDKMVFAKMLYDSQKIELINYKIYLNWFDTFSEEFPVNKVVYVKTDPEICHSRIMKRSREGESNIPLEYLKNCNNYHNNMLDVNLDDCVCNEQLILDGNVDIYENNDQLEKWINEIEGFIRN